MIESEKGFTLIELLVTLSILSILLLLPIITLPNLASTTHQADLMAKQLKEDLLLAQQLAMSTGRQTYVRVDNQLQEYAIRFSFSEVYLKRTYLENGMSIEPNTLSISSISFLANGHPTHSGSFILRIDDIRYRYTIYLGKGMISYKKL
ncbi:competence type IV pilus minor pilin ComGD [Halalkalibacter nanhaiisediminis]|uniref:Competence protein ComGD n=1 Tax=Halalkalibacter nanhaiisediminis TaxID=688079 RepID=A0A562QH51_9BACI|nr:competence type IV pilus minor pilin ComGD [Halalkalibacter nanhaiisediminis]TWI55993.1 competence protein ComGD [Halalkalibacter nanhaiisediminis]